MTRIISFLLLFAVQSTVFASDSLSINCHKDNEPTFDLFKVDKADKIWRKAKGLQFVDKKSKRYKTVISFGANKEANFAGHFRVVTWGCGSDCHQFAIVDLKKRTVFMSDTIELVAGAMGNDEDRIFFNVDSSLIVFNGLVNDEIEGKFFFNWKGGRLVFLCRGDLIKEAS